MELYRRDYIALTVVSCLALIATGFALLGIGRALETGLATQYQAAVVIGLVVGAGVMGAGLFVMEEVTNWIDDLFKGR